jgi:predicted DNA-binding transcriptional regulator AlpA
VKTFTRPKALSERLGLPMASLYDKVANDPRFPKPFNMGPRAVGFDDDEVLRYQLNLLAERDGVGEAERESWIEAEFIKQKAVAERVAELRAQTERPTRRKRLAAA